MERLLYLNVYAVTRHFGGREEGGWYFDRGVPLASVPVPAVRVAGHDDVCWICSQTRKGLNDKDGVPYVFCRQAPTDEQKDQWFDDNPKLKNDLEAWDSFAASFPEAYHLIPALKPQMEEVKATLIKLFDDINEGNIGSVLGGVEVRVHLEEEFAQTWPRERPRYE